ncbi:MAG TPA: c-type cytochrome [Nitrospira sp.]|nr:c-type cytochrome [Nitrospira sp.]
MDRVQEGRRRSSILGVAASVAWLLSCVLIERETGASQQAIKAQPASEGHGNVAAGRNVFNGKGICHYCHGIDGYRDKPPQLAPDTAALIAQLDPAPADLRNPKTLRLKSDEARAKIIREGHTGTGMFPTTTLTGQELADTLSYLAALRNEGQAGSSGEELYRASCIVCHGPRAMGGVGPRLAGNPVLLNDQAFWKVVHEGRHVMPPLKDTVTDQQLIDIRAWLKTLP